MHRSLLLLPLLWMTHLALSQEQAIPTLRILPEDVDQDSIRQSQAATNRFIVRWVYTGVGAKKVLDFREAHECKKVREVIGSFEALVSGTRFQSMPPCFTNYTQWKEGWIHFRTDTTESFI